MLAPRVAPVTCDEVSVTRTFDATPSRYKDPVRMLSVWRFVRPSTDWYVAIYLIT